MFLNLVWLYIVRPVHHVLQDIGKLLEDRLLPFIITFIRRFVFHFLLIRLLLIVYIIEPLLWLQWLWRVAYPAVLKWIWIDLWSNGAYLWLNKTIRPYRRYARRFVRSAWVSITMNSRRIYVAVKSIIYGRSDSLKDDNWAIDADAGRDTPDLKEDTQSTTQDKRAKTRRQARTPSMIARYPYYQPLSPTSDDGSIAEDSLQGGRGRSNVSPNRIHPRAPSITSAQSLSSSMSLGHNGSISSGLPRQTASGVSRNNSPAPVAVYRTPDNQLSSYDCQGMSRYFELYGFRVHYMDCQPAAYARIRATGTNMIRSGSSVTTTVVALPGRPSWSDHYAGPFAETIMSAGHRLIVLDAIGCGKSDKPLSSNGSTDRLERARLHRDTVINLIGMLQLNNDVTLVAEGDSVLTALLLLRDLPQASRLFRRLIFISPRLDTLQIYTELSLDAFSLEYLLQAALTLWPLRSIPRLDWIVQFVQRRSAVPGRDTSAKITRRRYQAPHTQLDATDLFDYNCQSNFPFIVRILFPFTLYQQYRSAMICSYFESIIPGLASVTEWLMGERYRWWLEVKDVVAFVRATWRRPTLTVSGEYDPIGSDTGSYLIKTVISPDATKETRPKKVPNAGHLLHNDAPEDLAQIICAFIQTSGRA